MSRSDCMFEVISSLSCCELLLLAWSQLLLCMWVFKFVCVCVHTHTNAHTVSIQDLTVNWWFSASMCFHVFPSLTRLGTDPLLQCNLLRPRPQRRPQRVGTGLDQLEGCCALLRLVAWLSGNLVMEKVVRWLTWCLRTCLISSRQAE